MRYQQMRMQAELVKATKESSTGQVADVGLALGGRTAQSVTFQRDLDRLNVIIDSNGLVAARLSSTQTSLGQLSSVAQTFLSSLTSATSGDSSQSLTQSAGKTTIQQLASILNTSVNGEYLFAGTNTDVKPINDFTAAGSPAKAAFDASFVAKFGFTADDPAAANITAAQMDDFITNSVEPQFLGSGWQTNMSNATDQQIVSRIALNETTPTSTSANRDGNRKPALAAGQAQNQVLAFRRSPEFLLIRSIDRQELERMTQQLIRTLDAPEDIQEALREGSEILGEMLRFMDVFLLRINGRVPLIRLDLTTAVEAQRLCQELRLLLPSTPERVRAAHRLIQTTKPLGVRDPQALQLLKRWVRAERGGRDAGAALEALGTHLDRLSQRLEAAMN